MSEDLAPDPSPEGTFDGLMDEMYEAGEFDLAQTDVLSLAEELLDARQASLHPEAYLTRQWARIPRIWEEWLQRRLAQGQERWQHFQRNGGSSVHDCVAAYIANEDAGRLDWAPILAAIEQAERGDWSSFEALQGDVYARDSEVMSVLEPGRRDPGVPATRCCKCDAIVPVADTWVNGRGWALCESCFLKAEAKGRARRRSKPFPSGQT